MFKTHTGTFDITASFINVWFDVFYYKKKIDSLKEFEQYCEQI